MDFSLSPELKELRSRVRTLVDDVLQPLELEAEQSHGKLSAATHSKVKQAVLASGLNAANIPTAYGGGGLNITEQIVMHEQLGRLTNCLWVLVWSPSNVLVHGRPDQIERYLLPDVRGEHRHAYAITEEHAGSDITDIRTTDGRHMENVGSPVRVLHDRPHRAARAWCMVVRRRRPV